MSFTDMQIVALEAKLRGKNVRNRKVNGVTLSYIEGWHVLAEANRIFGFDGWSRETVETRCVWDGPCQNRRACCYTARVRITVVAGEREIIREGCGSGHGLAPTAGDAHESALKEAETDATKRALVTFGNPFGLALYDKEQRGVTRRLARRADKPSPNMTLWELLDHQGTLHSQHTDPVDYCANFKRLLETVTKITELQALWDRNQNALLILKSTCPDLTSEKGQHYADILADLFAARQKRVEPANGEDDSQITDPGTTQPEATMVAAKVAKRIRNKDHLKYVASQPCVICGRHAAQAHHIRYAEPRAMSRKVGDQWTVPLCAIHHRSIHAAGDEKRWWQTQKQDPLVVAEQLWRTSQNLMASI